LPGHCCPGPATYPGASSGPLSSAPLFGLAPGGVCPASPVTRAAVSSYLAFSPLPLDKLGAVCFLWHFPWGHPRSPLATTLPCGARTFLPPEAGDHPTPFRFAFSPLTPLFFDQSPHWPADRPGGFLPGVCKEYYIGRTGSRPPAPSGVKS
jgi:hypothetical protein